MAAIAQTIAIVDRSGKVVSTSKQLKNIWLEAKLAYQERKAEIASDRKIRDEKDLRKAVKAMSLADEQERPRSHQHERRAIEGSSQRREARPTADRHFSSRSVRSNSSEPHSPGAQALHGSPARSPLSRSASAQHQQPTVESGHDYYASQEHSGPSSPRASNPPNYSSELTRRRTDLALEVAPPKPPRPGNLPRVHTSPSLYSHANDDIDMDLAYGEFHPESISPSNASLPDLNMSRSLTKKDQQQREKEELSSLVVKCKMLLDQANCAQHSVKAVMSHLQENPDAMAAVALTLAEISNIARKMAPGVLTALKAGAPTVFALLAAPEFLVAVGVGVGLTVVMFGGYKIIKKIAAKSKVGDFLRGPGMDRQGSMDEMINVDELSRIEHWRRGIADSQFGDHGSNSETRRGSEVSTVSVEGEYITPVAAKSLGHLPLPPKSQSSQKTNTHRERESERRHRKRKGSSGGSVGGASRGSSSKTSEKEKREKALVVKVKKPSPLRRMFKGEGSSVAS